MAAKRRHIDDAERRARMVARHHLAGTAPDVVTAVRGVVAMHSSDPLTPYIGLWARVPGFTTAHLDDAMYAQRTLWRLHAMRRTLFVVPSDEATIFEAGASRDVALSEWKKLEKYLALEMDPKVIRPWLADVQARTLALFTDGLERKTQDLAKHVPELATGVQVGSGKFTQRVPLSSRLVFLLALDGHIARSRPTGSWRSSQYHWVARSAFGVGDALDAGAGRVALLERYLATHGPATLADVRWWTGWTAKNAVAALAGAGAVTVDLDSGEGWLLASDVAKTKPTSHVSLLPVLDPTPMGWTERDWYLGPHRKRLFDVNGNIGPTIWVDGRIVGGWGQRPDGTVVTQLLEDVGAEASRTVDAKAAELTSWMGEVTMPRFRTPLERELSG